MRPCHGHLLAPPTLWPPAVTLPPQASFKAWARSLVGSGPASVRPGALREQLPGVLQALQRFLSGGHCMCLACACAFSSGLCRFGWPGSAVAGVKRTGRRVLLEQAAASGFLLQVDGCRATAASSLPDVDAQLQHNPGASVRSANHMRLCVASWKLLQKARKEWSPISVHAESGGVVCMPCAITPAQACMACPCRPGSGPAAGCMLQLTSYTRLRGLSFGLQTWCRAWRTTRMQPWGSVGRQREQVRACAPCCACFHCTIVSTGRCVLGGSLFALCTCVLSNLVA